MTEDDRRWLEAADCEQLASRLESIRFYTDGSGPLVPDCVTVTGNLEALACKESLTVGDLRSAAAFVRRAYRLLREMDAELTRVTEQLRLTHIDWQNELAENAALREAHEQIARDFGHIEAANNELRAENEQLRAEIQRMKDDAIDAGRERDLNEP